MEVDMKGNGKLIVCMVLGLMLGLMGILLRGNFRMIII